jgi:pimeloyl-ACP methyl ester carboxylesterase/DNA-binding CsgD family transcriptional regulator/class 3 adenylate cyclase
MLRETRYARSGEASLAYQTFGDGPVEIVLGIGWLSNLDAIWEEPRYRRYLAALGSFARVIAFDARGTGLSDAIPLTERLTIDERAADVLAVVEAAGAFRPALVGYGVSGVVFAHAAAKYPEAIGSLVLINSASTGLTQGTAPDDGGAPIDVLSVAPGSAGYPSFAAWWAQYLRRSASPGSTQALAQMNAALDARPVLPHVTVPTLVLHRAGNRRVPIAEGRALAAAIPGAVLRELPGDDHLPFLGDSDALVGEIEQFLTGSRRTRDLELRLGSVLVVEVTDGAERALALGEEGWADLWARFEAELNVKFESHGGQRIASLPTGAMASFPVPLSAVNAALSLVESVRALGLSARAAVHAGELPTGRPRVSGAVAQMATQASRLASAGEVLVTDSIAALAVGADVRFEPAGNLPIPGYPGGWQLHRVSRSGRMGAGPRSTGIDGHSLAVLSRREREIAALIALGLANRQIADELSISVATVERHVANMLGKLGYRSRTQVAAWAVEHGLLTEALP